MYIFLFLGTFFYWNMESEIEAGDKEEMLGKAADINISLNYISDHLTYIAYGDSNTREGSYNNCTVFIDDPYWTNGSLHDVCLDRMNANVNASRFCHCIWSYKERYEEQVL